LIIALDWMAVMAFKYFHPGLCFREELEESGEWGEAKGSDLANCQIERAWVVLKRYDVVICEAPSYMRF